MTARKPCLLVLPLVAVPVAVALIRGPAARAAAPPPARLAFQDGHTGRVLAVAFSPDGRTLASGGADGLVKLWRPATGELIRTISQPRSVSIPALAWAPDGSTLAAAGQHPYDSHGRVYLWDSRNGALRRTLHVGKNTLVNSVAFAQDGRTLITASSEYLRGRVHGSLKQWDPLTGSLQRENLGHRAAAIFAEFSRDGRHLVSASMDGDVRVWDRRSGASLRRLHTSPGAMPSSVALLHDDQRLVVSLDTGTSSAPRAEVVVWPLTGGGRSARIVLPGMRPYSLAALPGDRVAVGTEDGSIHLLDLRGRGSRVLARHRDLVSAIAVSGDGLASGSGDRSVRVWRLSDGRPLSAMMPAAAPPSPDLFGGSAIALAGAERLVVGRPDSVLEWDPALARLSRQHQGVVSPSAMSPDGRWLAAEAEETRARRGAAVMLRRLVTHREHLLQASIPGSHVTALAFSPDNRRLLTADWQLYHAQIHLWNVETGMLVRTLVGWDAGEAFAHAVAFSPDGQLAAAAASPGVRLWNAATGEPVRQFSIRESPASSVTVRAIAFSPDGRTLAGSTGEGTIRVWSVADGRLVRLLPGHRSPVAALAFSADGGLLAVGHREGVRFWNAASWVPAGEIRAGGPVTSLALLPDARRFAVVTSSGVLTLWNLRQRRLLATFLSLPPARERHPSTDWIIFTPNGDWTGSPRAAEFIRWQRGSRVLANAALTASRRRPEMVAQAARAPAGYAVR